MIINYIHKVIWFVGLVLLQVLVLNHIHLWGYATPFLYLYFILKLESTTSRHEQMLWAFFLGLVIDVFSNTPGMNAAATVFLAFIRPFLLRLFTPRDILDNIVPSFKSMGNLSFVRYIISAVCIQNLILLSIESFSFSSSLQLFLRVIACSAITIVGILGIESIRK